jgi:hypothetical protein
VALKKAEYYSCLSTSLVNLLDPFYLARRRSPAWHRKYGTCQLKSEGVLVKEMLLPSCIASELFIGLLLATFSYFWFTRKQVL